MKSTDKEKATPTPEELELQAAKLIAAALSDRTLSSVEQEKRDRLRADLFKNMVITLNN